MSLAAMCSKVLSKRMAAVEVGCYAGESTAVFSKFCRSVYAVDPWTRAYPKTVVWGCRNPVLVKQLRDYPLPPMTLVEAAFDRVVQRAGNIVKLRMTSSRAAMLFSNNSVDFVYIDALHTFKAVREDLTRWIPKLTGGGVLAGHDYSESDWPEVIRAVNDVVGVPDAVYPDSSWIKRM